MTKKVAAAHKLNAGMPMLFANANANGRGVFLTLNPQPTPCTPNRSIEFPPDVAARFVQLHHLIFASFSTFPTFISLNIPPRRVSPRIEATSPQCIQMKSDQREEREKARKDQPGRKRGDEKGSIIPLLVQLVNKPILVFGTRAAAAAVRGQLVVALAAGKEARAGRS